MIVHPPAAEVKHLVSTTNYIGHVPFDAPDLTVSAMLSMDLTGGQHMLK